MLVNLFIYLFIYFLIYLLIRLFTYTYIFIYKNRLNYFILNRLFPCCFAFYKFVAISRKYLSTLCHSYSSNAQLPLFSHNKASSNISKLSFIILIFLFLFDRNKCIFQIKVSRDLGYNIF